MQNQQNITPFVLRKDLPSFIRKAFHTVNPGTAYCHNWHIDLIAEHLLACEKGYTKRLIINIPPRHLKSLIVNVAWPAWLLGQNPSRRIISTSYSQALATKHSLDTRLIINSPWYQNIFLRTLIVADQNEKDKFITTKRGFRLATSTGGTLTGEGGNFLILDDPHNPVNINSKTIRDGALNWYEQVFSSRLDDKNSGVIVLIMQRLHTEDLTGHLLSKNSKWEHLNIPALAERTMFFPSPLKRSCGFLFPEKFPLHPDKENINTLKQTESEMGSFAFSAQYLQNPLPLNDGLIKPEWLKYYNTQPHQFSSITQSWDTAIKAGENNDYTVCTTWGEADNCYYLLDMFRNKLEYPALKRNIISLAEKWQPNSVLIEDKASGGSLIQELRLETKLPVIAINPKLDKFSRLLAVSSLIESGRVQLPQKAAYLTELEAELFGFPNSPHDDIVDSITQFLNWTKAKNALKPSIRRL